MGFRIFARSLWQVFADLFIVIRLSWLWIAFFVAIGASGMAYLPKTAIRLHHVDPASISTLMMALSGILFGFPLLLILLIVVSALAIGWHRWIVKRQPPGWLHILGRGAPIVSYGVRFVWRWLLATLVIVLPVILILPIAGHLAGSPEMKQLVSDNPIPFISGGLVMVILLLTIWNWLFFRGALGLPAVALGKRVSIVLSFRLTDPVSGALFVTALCMAVFLLLAYGAAIFATSIETNPLTQYGAFATVALCGVATWISLFTFLGVLSIVYQHVVEDKPV